MDAATILHADLDAFYASVEQVLDPRLAGRPIAVGGGVVLAASYEAKAYGVRGGMSESQARRLCPGLHVVGGHFREYQRLSDVVMGVLADFTPVVQRISIDEAFLDVRGSVHLLGTPTHIGAEIRRRVRAETGLAISVGVARTKHLAKIASQVAKPDDLIRVEPEHELEFLHPLPVELIWGVGPVTKRHLDDLGISTIGELAALPRASLEHLLGRAAGARLGSLARNLDSRPVESDGRPAASVGAQSALRRQAADTDLIARVLRNLADRIATRLRKSGRAGFTVTGRLRFADMQSVTRSVTLSAPVSTTSIIAEMAAELVAAALADHPDEHEVTLLAISVSHLVEEHALQLELPLDLEKSESRPGSKTGADHWALDRAVDSVRERFGSRSIGFASVVLSPDASVPDAFRELAERRD